LTLSWTGRCAMSVSLAGLLLGAGCAGLYARGPRYARSRRPGTAGRTEERPAVAADERQGRLGWPVVGTVVQSFGVRVHPKYGTKTKSQGLDIACAKGSPVKASYDGRVSFAESFMGYGRMVIVDHGEQLHSIYSRLSEIRVSVGTLVRKGETIAFAGDTLHFEVRKAGKSHDPELWLSRR
jgi:septal ring factor EnvC (AmiA/AmiB activator)